MNSCLYNNDQCKQDHFARPIAKHGVPRPRQRPQISRSRPGQKTIVLKTNTIVENSALSCQQKVGPFHSREIE